MKKLMSIVTAAVLALSLAGCNVSPKMGSGNAVVATAGDAKVMLRDVNYYLGVYKYEYESMYAQFGLDAEAMQDYWITEIDEDGTTAEEELIQLALENAQQNTVFYELGKAEGLTFDKDEIDYYESAIKSTVINIASKERTGERAFYEMFFVTPDEFIEVEKIASVANQYKEMITDSIEVTEDEIFDYYEENKHLITEYTVRHVLVKFDEEAEDEEASKAEKYAQAEEILAMAQNGADFGELAAEYSEDDGSKDNNGEYVITDSTNFVQPFKSWTFEAKTGDMGIIETDYGYHVMNLVSVSEYEDHIEAMEQQIQVNKADELLEQLHDEAGYEWTVDESVFSQLTISNFGQ